jgi:hypothetical protein
MITNFVIDDGVLRHKEVARRRATFSVVTPAAKTPVAHRVPRLVCSWALDPITGKLSASWAAASSDAGVRQNCDQNMDPGRPRPWILTPRFNRARSRAVESRAA